MEMTEAVSTVGCQGLGGKAFIFFHPSAFWISLGPRCATEMLWSSVRWFTHRVGHAAHLHLDSSDGPGPDAWRGHDELVVELCVLHFFSGAVQKVTRDCLCYQKDVLDLCPRYFDEILQVL